MKQKKNGDPRPRNERRLDPERWFQVTELSEPGILSQRINVEGNDLHLQGPIEDVIAITIPRESFSEAATILATVKQVFEDTGIECRNIIGVPEGVRFMKLRPLGTAENAHMNKRKYLNDVRKDAVRQKEAEDAS